MFYTFKASHSLRDKTASREGTWFIENIVVAYPVVIRTREVTSVYRKFVPILFIKWGDPDIQHDVPLYFLAENLS